MMDASAPEEPVASVTRADRKRVEQAFRVASGPRLLRQTAWVYRWMVLCALASLVAFLFFYGSGVQLDADGGQALSGLARREVLWSGGALALSVAGIVLTALWRLQIDIRNHWRVAGTRRANQEMQEALRRVRLFDLLRARLRAAKRAHAAVSDLLQFDAPDLYEGDTAQFPALAARVEPLNAKSVFFYGPPPLRRVQGLAAMPGGDRLIFETNPIKTATLFLTRDQLIIVEAVLDLARGATLEETVTRLFLTDLVRMQYREALTPRDLIEDASALPQRERENVENLRRRLSVKGAAVYHRERAILLTHADGGATVLPIGGRLILESEASAAEDWEVENVETEEEAVARIIDERVTEQKRRLWERRGN